MNDIAPPQSILFVCLGNICRSPSAEAVFRQLMPSIHVDSAGTAGFHIGERPDSRAISTGKRLGYDLSTLLARQVTPEDFYRFDVIFAMDNDNLAALQALLQNTQHTTHAKIASLHLFDEAHQQIVADPYYGDISDFVAMFAHIEQVAQYYKQHWRL